ncbi:MAG: hypothetical protein O7C75_20835, partial [Verrucomicrobia bacterium]|nr:hypothetical protein [Verrucomicrobiota bacterium]
MKKKGSLSLIKYAGNHVSSKNLIKPYGITNIEPPILKIMTSTFEGYVESNGKTIYEAVQGTF